MNSETYQIIIGLHLCKSIWEYGRKIVDVQMILPWFINSFGLLLLPAPCCSLDCAAVLIEDMLRCDCKALFSISCGLVLQKSSDKLRCLTERPWILKPLEGSSTAIIGVGFAHPKQFLLCCKPGWTNKWLEPSTEGSYLNKQEKAYAWNILLDRPRWI